MIKKNGTKSKIIVELMKFFEEVLAPYLDEKFGGVDNRLDKVENRLDGVENRLDGVENRLGNVETELMYVKTDVKNLKADMPTAKEFHIVKKTVDKLEKIHKKELSAFA